MYPTCGKKPECNLVTTEGALKKLAPKPHRMKSRLQNVPHAFVLDPVEYGSSGARRYKVFMVKHLQDADILPRDMDSIAVGPRQHILGISTVGGRSWLREALVARLTPSPASMVILSFKRPQDMFPQGGDGKPTVETRFVNESAYAVVIGGRARERSYLQWKINEGLIVSTGRDIIREPDKRKRKHVDGDGDDDGAGDGATAGPRRRVRSVGSRTRSRRVERPSQYSTREKRIKCKNCRVARSPEEYGYRNARQGRFCRACCLRAKAEAKKWRPCKACKQLKTKRAFSADHWRKAVGTGLCTKCRNKELRLSAFAIQ